ncbi:MAG TPA: M48 family metalloprotease [Dehalococcoidia bacterium]|nr:M48 family metalloprotease [Dehalococcoidia bacterium]
MGLQLRMYLLLGLLFGIIYAIIVAVGSAVGAGFLWFYIIIAVGLIFLQYLIGPSMVKWTMRVQYVSEREYPKLHEMVAELARASGIKKPQIGISKIPIPNAFAFGRTRGGAKVCVTEALLSQLREDELRAVLGHELSHIKHNDMALMTLLSVFPLIIYYMAIGMIFSGYGRGNRGGGGNPLPLIGLGLLVLYFITNLLVLYGSRIREYYADVGSLKLGNRPRHLATALYKLAYGNARVPKESLKRIEGLKAFFVNDPSRALTEVSELRQVDLDMDGTIDREELEILRSKSVVLRTGDKLMELMSTHPNMLKRIKHLAQFV